jgi:hypothetical protein
MDNEMPQQMVEAINLSKFERKSMAAGPLLREGMEN